MFLLVEDIVPTEIKLMADKRSIDMYLKLLESGSEKKRDIRLVIVGKKGAGKTSLIKRLFSEDIIDVTSTNGIEIHTVKCKAMSNDGIWKKSEGTNEETDINARLLKQYKETIDDSNELETDSQHPKIMNPHITTKLQIESQVSIEPQAESQVTIEPQVETAVDTESQQHRSIHQEKMAKMDIETMLKSNVDF
ncbi:unnamed protein product [Mytilus edulis]|uniref:Uncharacterized protein n=1 Tax=Mytilus edulis TaxID=6550 RepID=A0A8S3QH32_MYTED|nr:unnamed protein product [Mytilus edulis]